MNVRSSKHTANCAARARGLFAALLAMFASLLLAVPALAVPARTIAPYGPHAGQVERPVGVAVDNDPASLSHGDIYVADENNKRIDKFGPTDQFLLAWGYGVRDGAPELETCGPEALPSTTDCLRGERFPTSVAVDPTTSDVYVAERSTVEKFTPSGELLFRLEHSFGGEPSVTVDSSGNLWVGNINRVEEFNASGAFLSQFQAPTIKPGAEDSVVAVVADTAPFSSSHENLYVLTLESESASFTRHLFKLEPNGTVLEVIDASGFPLAFGLDPASGDLYVGEYATNGYALKRYDFSGHQLQQFGGGRVIGHPEGNALALDASGHLYVASSASEGESAVQRFFVPEPGPLLLEGTQKAVERASEVATLTATLDPEGQSTHYRFQYVDEESFEHEGGFASPHTKETPPAELPASDFGEYPVSARVEGLVPETRYRFRVVASNHCNPSVPAQACTIEGERDEAGNEIPASFEPLPLAEVQDEWMSEPSSSEATLNASVVPNGNPSEYVFQYASAAAYEATGQLASETPVRRFVAPGLSAVQVSARLQDLAGASGYDYRIVIHHGAFRVTGPVKGFSTQPAVRFSGLPDARTLELVARGANGAGLYPPYGGLPRAAEGGGAFAYGREAAITAGAEGNRAPLEPTVDMARHGPGGWGSADITTPYDAVVPTILGEGTEYRLFSGDLSAAVVTPRDANPLSPQASERTPYRRLESPGGVLYEPLLTAADVAEGVKFGGNIYAEPQGVQEIEGADPSLAHVVLRSRVALTSGSVPLDMYEWSAGGLAPVSVLPAGEGGGFVRGSLGGQEHEDNARNAVSSDGLLVYWTGPGGLYLRDMRTQPNESLRLDVPQVGVVRQHGEVEGAEFQIASADGSRVFFTDTQRLTAGATANATAPDLYECVVGAPSGGPPSCALSDITEKVLNGGESADVQGLLAGADEAGTRLYFVAKGVLASGASAGEYNLYTAVESGGSWRLAWITTLSSGDLNAWGRSSRGDNGLANLMARSSPDGRWFAFVSDRSLTGYDNQDLVSGTPDLEVYLYDARSERLSCVSCDPTGARPRGLVDPDQGAGALLGDEEGRLRGRWLAAFLPEWRNVQVGGTLTVYQPRYLSDSGRLFFQSATALVPQASNGAVGVYEYEPAGVGSCTGSAGGFVAGTGGCVSLISPGTAVGEAAFADASANGDDVFMLAAVSASEASFLAHSVYDAHSCETGSSWVCAPPGGVAGPPCSTTESCRSAPPPQPSIYGAPSSATFSGQGNVAPTVVAKKIVKKRRVRCAKGKTRRKGRCVRGKAKAKKAKARRARAGRSSTTRRGGR